MEISTIKENRVLFIFSSLSQPFLDEFQGRAG
jgi:hypothetical protein